MTKPWTHLLEVEMRLNWAANAPAQTEFIMPVWTPGSYLVREYARHVESFNAADAPETRSRGARRTKTTGRSTRRARARSSCSYNVYSNELTVRTNELNDNHAFFHARRAFDVSERTPRRGSTVRVVPFKDWKVATGLPLVKAAKTLFAPRISTLLYDSPFEVGSFKERISPCRASRTASSLTARAITICRASSATRRRSSRNLQDFRRAALRKLSVHPESARRRRARAFELDRSAVEPFGFTGTRHNDFMALVAHEFFHLWNVKRIRPDALGPFDYENENYTRLLWVAEGATAYYEAVLLQRAGIISTKEFLEAESPRFSRFRNARQFETSLEEASFDAWIKYYRQDENAINNQISYYDKGELVNFLLDVEIRAGSQGAKSLDDVMRYLNTEFAKKNRNFTPEDYQKAAEMMAGQSWRFLREIRARARRNRVQRDFKRRRLAAQRKRGRETPYLGANLRQDGDRLVISSCRKARPPTSRA
jgi:predicted metalloprotease with PDZ domain